MDYTKDNIEKIIKNFDSNITKIKDFKGYYFVNSKKFQGNRIINCPGEYHQKKFDDSIIMRKLLAGVKNRNKDKIEAEICEKILAMEYKFHFMPTEENILPVLEELLNACKEDSDLFKLIADIKIKMDPKIKTNRLNQIMPEIVIYPSLGIENADLLLSKLIDKFKSYDLIKIWNGLTPRFNRKITGAFFYAQSNSEIKTALNLLGENLFTPSQSLFKGDGHALTIPPLKNSTKVNLFVWGDFTAPAPKPEIKSELGKSSSSRKRQRPFSSFEWGDFDDEEQGHPRKKPRISCEETEEMKAFPITTNRTI